MAELKKKTAKKTAAKPVRTVVALQEVAVPEDMRVLWEEACLLEQSLEKELLEDAVKSGRLALEELHAETKTQPFERRRGLRLREKAERVERAFNRLRALRKGDLLPERHPDD
jgi:hypothetical protein